MNSLNLVRALMGTWYIYIWYACWNLRRFGSKFDGQLQTPT